MDQFTITVGGVVFVFKECQLEEVMDMLSALSVANYFE